MKKSILCFGISVFLLFSCISCADTPPASTVNKSSDYTVELDAPLQWEGKTIQESPSMTEPRKVYNTFSDYVDETVAVVRGTIKNVEYFRDGAYPFTKIDLDITESLFGPLGAGDKISAFKFGGYIALRDFAPDIQERYPEITDEEVANTIQDVKVNGDPHPTVGQDVLLFLEGPYDTSTLYAGMYGIVGGYFGQFTNDGNGNFTRHIEGIPHSDKTEVDGYTLSDSPTVDRGKMAGTERVFTFNQLKSEVEAVFKQ